MDLGEYFSKAFGNMFSGQIYLTTFLTYLLALVTSIIIGAIIFFAFIGSSGLTLLSTLADPTAMSNPAAWMGLVGGAIAAFIIFEIIMSYLFSVAQAFIIKKIKANDDSKKEGFFDGFGECFGIGLKILGASIIYVILLCLVGLILFLIALIPILGWIVLILAVIFLIFYLPIMFLSMVGTMAIKNKFGEALARGLTLPFRKPLLMLYVFVLMIVYILLAIVLGLLSMIPILGILIMIFGAPLLVNYFMTIAYNLSKE